jgi:APA family basic amino acid/polyamine antiporter
MPTPGDRETASDEPAPVNLETRNPKPETASRGSLLRILGVGFGLAVIIGNTIGAGIMQTPGSVAALLPNPALYLGVWVAGGLYALLGSFSMAELGAMMPRSGGYYVFARRAFGEYPGFLIGWTDFLAQVGSTSAVALVAAEYLGFLIPFFSGQSRRVALASALAILLAVLQWRGIRWGAIAQNLSSAAKALGFVGLIAAIFMLAPPAAREIHPISPVGLFASIILSLQFVIYTYDGWYAIIYFGEEVRVPSKDVPRSMFGGVLSLTAIYVLINVALVYALPMSKIAGNDMAAGTASNIIFGRYGDAVIRSVLIVSMLSAINAYHLMASRIPFAMAQDGLLTKKVARVNQGGTPTVALLLSVLAAVAFILGGKTFEKVANIMAFYFAADYTIAYATLLVLRRREPYAERPYRAWGYPWVTVLALLLGVAFLVGKIATDIAGLNAGHKWYTLDSIDSILVLAVSYPLYLLFGLRRKVTEVR